MVACSGWVPDASALPSDCHSEPEEEGRWDAPAKPVPSAAAGDTVAQDGVKPCNGKPFDVTNQLELNSRGAADVSQDRRVVGSSGRRATGRELGSGDQGDARGAGRVGVEGVKLFFDTSVLVAASEQGHPH